MTRPPSDTLERAACAGDAGAEAGIDISALNRALDSVRPFILGHGGDARIADITAEGVVEIAFTGACRACPNIAMTFAGPVRTALMQVPGVIGVTSSNVHAGPRALARMARLLGAHPYTA
jgi:Fe-S cluster biogenesis protein NfuA